ncbi:SMP-30/gluconolactonase/LRE family protein [Serratia rubidaea]|uniref:SMP-30/gluconolactonase/LRE family protein n=1 Tax=Serratia rubidaea TaxID=61652 RepID=UPI001F1BD141|nr:SMP-30/gluconolactonase/LRE family protein [Serratia rubidaea]UJD79597.1 SMP-30/gluconolactonase/LRE family protein [Serratia rubidaea]UJD84153.1 SMP-30/gluconolactonase/LRE family protein [Serratia rubidaea]
MTWLTSPETRQMVLFSRLPDHFRRPDAHNAWAAANRGGQLTDSFLEGPVWHPDGYLLVSDIPYGRIFRVDMSGRWELLVQYDGEPNGMKLTDPDTLIITDYRHGLMKLSLQERRIAPWLSRRNSESFRGVNDLTPDSQGNLYFTDQGQTGLHDPTGRVYRLGQDGRLDLLLDNCPSPNGLVLSPDEKVLYVAMTRGNCVWRVPLQPDGSVSKVGQFFTSFGPSGPDGLTVNQHGELLIANPGLGRVWLLNELAEPIEILLSPAGRSTTNLCFGGEGFRQLFVTESVSGAILTCPMRTPGRQLPSLSTAFL